MPRVPRGTVHNITPDTYAHRDTCIQTCIHTHACSARVHKHMTAGNPMTRGASTNMARMHVLSPGSTWHHINHRQYGSR